MTTMTTMTTIKSSKRQGLPHSARWVLAGLLAVLAAFSAGVGTAYADDNEDDLSLYAVSSSVTSYFSSAVKPGSDKSDFEESWDVILGSPGTAGAVVGYADKDFNPITWLVSQATASSQAIEYSTLDSLGPGVREYAEFGATLQGLGLDTTSTGLSNNLMNFVMGGTVFMALVLSQLVNWTFTLVLDVLVWLNPFRLLYAGVQAISPNMASGMVGGDVPQTGALQGLATYIGGIYTTVNSLSWAVLVPVFVAVTIIFMLLGKGQGMMRKLIVRLLFIVVGVPLLGSMYTGILDGMKDATSGADSGAIQVVSATFVDFEGWSTQARLAVPSQAVVEWYRPGDRPTLASSIAVQDTSRYINAMVHPSLSTLTPMFSLDGDDEGTWEAPVVATTEQDASAWSVALSMLTRFMMGDDVPSSSFASDVQGQLTNQLSDGNAPESAAEWFSSLREDDLDESVSDNFLINVRSGSGLEASANNGTVTFSTPSGSQNAYCNATVVWSNGNSAPCNLSALAMYNYLNTSFDSTSMTTYSSQKVASGAVQEVHDSVSLVGTGIESMIYWFNALVLLVCFVLIGIGYALAIFAGNLRMGIKVLTAVPFAMFGAIGAITKVIVYVIAMVLELIVTIFLYKVVQELLLAMPKIFSHFAGTLLESAGPAGAVGAASVAGGAIAIAIPLIISLVIIAITVMALRLRKTVVKAITEASTKAIELLIGGNTTGAESGGSGAGRSAVAGVAGGAMAGAGMVAGGRMMKGGGAATESASGSGPEGAGAGGTSDTSAPDSSGPDGSTGSGPSGANTGGAIVAAAGQLGTGGGSDGGSGARSSESADTKLGSQVAQNGLTALPGGAGGAGGAGGTEEESSGAGSANPDFLDSAVEAGERDNAARKEISKEKREAATGGAVAAGTAARGVARAYAGDVQGAASDGMSAASKAQASSGKAQNAKQAKHQLDSPENAVGSTPSRQRSVAGPAAHKPLGGTKPATAPKPQAQTPQKPQPATTAQGPKPRPAAKAQAPKPQGGGQSQPKPKPKPKPKPATPKPRTLPTNPGVS